MIIYHIIMWKWSNIEKNWKGFSFFEIQTPPANQKVPLNPANFETPPLFIRPKKATPPYHLGGEAMQFEFYFSKTA